MKHLLGLFAFLLLASCTIGGMQGNGEDNYYSDFQALPESVWAYDTTLSFTPDTLADSVARGGALVLAVRHSADYAYANLWLELSWDDSDTTERRDTVNMILADTHGRWLGTGTGVSKQKLDTVSRHFDLRRRMPVRVRHIMRANSIVGIEQIGLIYYPAK